MVVHIDDVEARNSTGRWNPSDTRGDGRHSCTVFVKDFPIVLIESRLR